MNTPRLAFALAAAALCVPTAAVAQPVRPHILFIFDTSTSMLSKTMCPSGATNGDCDGSPLCNGGGQDSRIFRLKQAIRETLFEIGTDEANFGLARFAQRTTPGTNRGCYRGHYVNAADGCKTSAPSETPDGAWFTPDIAQEVVVVPVTRVFSPAGAADYDPPGANIAELYRWLDNVETSDGTSMTNPEIRSGGSRTPLANSLIYARLYFEKYVKPRDPKTGCRKDIVILVTDGAETCSGNAPAAAEALFRAGVEVYVVVQDGEAGTVHNDIARRGSGGLRTQSIKVDFTNPEATKRALINIVAEAVPPGEVCNGKDDNCNGLVDEGILPGVGVPCLCPGLMESQVGKGMCRKGMSVCEMGQVVCRGCVGPDPEVCNGKDDNCNGLIDEDIPDEGKVCACAPHTTQTLTTGECRAGKLVCRGQMPLECEGCVTPVQEICDCKDNNCNGQMDEGNPCGEGFACVGCKCQPLCREGEFPCPNGFTCNQKENPPVCESHLCANKICPAGFVCEEGTGQCVDACQGRQCTAPKTCIAGRCVDCYDTGCSDGELCLAGECKPNPCADKKCGEGQFCNEKGQCEGLCREGCPQGQRCDRGRCVADLCVSRNVLCGSSEVCDPGTGECKMDVCQLKTCGSQRCVPLTGECKDDPCHAAACPAGGCYECRMGVNGGAQCVLRPECVAERGVVHTRGGGCNCALGAPEAAPWAPLALLLAAGAFLIARRRRR